MQTFTLRKSPSGPIENVSVPTDTNDLQNASGVSGATLTDALNTLNAGGPASVVAIRREAIEVIPLVIPVDLSDGVEHVVQDGVIPFTAELLLPDPALNYGAVVDLDVEYYGGLVGGAVALYVMLDAAIDGGAYTNFYYGQVNLYADANASSSRHVRCQMKPVAGALLGVVPGTASLKFQVRASASGVPSGGIITIQSLSAGTLALVLSERY